MTGVDAGTFALRLGQWSGWIHADPGSPLLDVVIVVAELRGPDSRLDADEALALQSESLRFGRLVQTPTQALVATTVPLHAFTAGTAWALLNGLIEDARAATALVRSNLPLTPGEGGYL